MAKLELDLGEEITYPLYIAPTVLKQKPDEFGGITINNEKDIICQKEGIIINYKKEDLEIEKRNLEVELKVANENMDTLKRIVNDNIRDETVRNRIWRQYAVGKSYTR